ncbi:hypothetical protein FJY90_04110 [Candidatus Gottesmanbacteria bacterium]|nr:hypothetical protein [Candidatus Gottesmanbacteria bacterium]
MKKLEYQQAVISVVLFSIIGLIALQIPFSRILGSGVKFTLFDFFAPSVGAFLGTIPGVISVLLMQVGNIILHGGKIQDISVLIRLLPTLFAVVYFAKKRAFNVMVPLIAIVAFNLHPIGRSAWQYSLFWLIPIAAHFFRRNLFARSLGATFAAHCVGSTLWVWAFGLSREMWLALIPQTAMERVLMATGISISYIFLTNVAGALSKHGIFPLSFHLEKRYLIS